VGTQLPLPEKKAQPPPNSQFLTPLSHVYCGQTTVWIKIPLGKEVNIGLGDLVLDGGRSSPPPKRGTARQSSAHVYCGQTPGWIQRPLGKEVDLGPGHIVLDENPAPPAKGEQQPPLISDHVYCGYSRPSQLLLSSFSFIL